MAAKKISGKKTTTKTTRPERVVKKSSIKTSGGKASPKRDELESHIVTSADGNTTPSVEKKKQLNKTAAIIGILALVLLLFYVFRSSFIVAFVNGQPIFTSEFNRQLQKDAGKQALNEILTKDLIFQEAMRKHISINEKDVNAQMKTIEDTLKKQKQTLDAALAAKNLTRQDLADQIKIKLIVDKILGPQLKVTDKEVQDYIDQNKDSLPNTQQTDQLKMSIKDRLMQDKLSQKFQDWIAQLQRDAKINYLIKI